MMQVTLITPDALLDSILAPYRAALGPALYAGYRHHAYRMLNFGRVLAPPAPERAEWLAIMAAFHDLPFCLDGNLDYLDRAAALTDAWLAQHGRAA